MKTVFFLLFGLIESSNDIFFTDFLRSITPLTFEYENQSDKKVV